MDEVSLVSEITAANQIVPRGYMYLERASTNSPRMARDRVPSYRSPGGLVDINPRGDTSIGNNLSMAFIRKWIS